MEKNNKEKNHCYWIWPSIGSDESGTGGLFGGAVYVAVRITNTTISKLKEGKLKKIWENKEKKIL